MSTIFCLDSFLIGYYNKHAIKKRPVDPVGKEFGMNYFGLVFSFMVPGMVVGGMAATLLNEAARKRRRALRKKR